jgi:hypothetical protein
MTIPACAAVEHSRKAATAIIFFIMTYHQAKVEQIIPTGTGSVIYCFILLSVQPLPDGKS